MYAHELFEQNKPRVVVTYPGRFQPFHQGHAGVFSQLQKKFGAENVFIATSNDQSSAKSPFNFSDKYQLMTAAGVPADKIIQTNAMYALPEGIDPLNTIFITAVGAPDADRLNPDSVLKRDKKDKSGNIIKAAGSPGYYKKWDPSRDPVSADQHGYVIVIPEIKKSIKIGSQIYDVSHGTETRNLWNAVRDDEKSRLEFLSQLYGRPSSELANIFDKIPQTAKEDIAPGSSDSTSPIHGGQIYEQVVTEGARVARKPGQPVNSKKHSDLYTDENPRGTITGLKFATVEDARTSVSKIRSSGRSHAHKIQAAVAMEQRARAAGKTEAAAVYRKYINANKKTSKTEGVAEDATDSFDYDQLSAMSMKDRLALYKTNPELKNLYNTEFQRRIDATLNNYAWMTPEEQAQYTQLAAKDQAATQATGTRTTYGAARYLKQLFQQKMDAKKAAAMLKVHWAPSKQLESFLQGKVNNKIELSAYLAPNAESLGKTRWTSAYDPTVGIVLDGHITIGGRGDLGSDQYKMTAGQRGQQKYVSRPGQIDPTLSMDTSVHHEVLVDNWKIKEIVLPADIPLEIDSLIQQYKIPVRRLGNPQGVAEVINPMTANTAGAGAGMMASYQARENQPVAEDYMEEARS